MTTYSYSRLNTFDNCPLRYKFSYIAKAEGDFENSIEAFMGSKVHDALEKLYKELKFANIMSLDDVLEYYKKQWKKTMSHNIKVIRDGRTKKEYHNMGLKYLTDYYNHYKPFNQDYTVGLETEIKVDLFGDGKYIFKGYIDRLSTINNTYIIHDYKTSNTLSTQSDIENNEQLALYALALKDKYIDLENIELVWHYLAFDKEFRITKKTEDYSALKEELKDKVDKIESLSEEEFEPKESILCEWCEFASLCPKRKHVVRTKQLGLEAFSKDYGVQLANKYIELSERKGQLGAEFDALEQKIFEYSSREKIDTIYAGIGVIKIYKDASFKLPAKGSAKFEKIKQILKESGLEQYLTVDSYGLVKSINIKLIPEEVARKILPLIEEKEFKKIYLRKTT